jgi:hypothetical protein
LSLKSVVLLLDAVEIAFQFVDLLHILVLNSEVFQLCLNLPNAVLDLVLLLNVSD